jgi:hypothetical protein
MDFSIIKSVINLGIKTEKLTNRRQSNSASSFFMPNRDNQSNTAKSQRFKYAGYSA